MNWVLPDTPREEAQALAEALGFPFPLAAVLCCRGFRTVESAQSFLFPRLEHTATPFALPDMTRAILRVRTAIERQEEIALYSDRDVDGLAGLAILIRGLRTLGARLRWAFPKQGRGLQLERVRPLIQGARVLITVDCGSVECAEVADAVASGTDVIICDHHRHLSERPPALAWIHPALHEGGVHAEEWTGALCAFKLMQALWLSFLPASGDGASPSWVNDPRTRFWIEDHLDLVTMGLVADLAPLVGENRIWVKAGLAGLPRTRKVGLQSIFRLFHLGEAGPLSMRDLSWRVIPLLNAAGRQGRAEVALRLLLTDDAREARHLVDGLLRLNEERRQRQEQGLRLAEEALRTQCDVASDRILVAVTSDVQPSLSGLVAHRLVEKYRRPVVVMVENGDKVVGSVRTEGSFDVFQLLVDQRDILDRFGGHRGAAGFTLDRQRVPEFRERLSESFRTEGAGALSADGLNPTVEAEASLQSLGPAWWRAWDAMEPFGPGHPPPLLLLRDVELIPRGKTDRGELRFEIIDRKEHGLAIASAALSEVMGPASPGQRWDVAGHPERVRSKGQTCTRWVIQGMRPCLG